MLVARLGCGTTIPALNAPLTGTSILAFALLCLLTVRLMTVQMGTVLLATQGTLLMGQEVASCLLLVSVRLQTRLDV